MAFPGFGTQYPYSITILGFEIPLFYIPIWVLKTLINKISTWIGHTIQQTKMKMVWLPLLAQALHLRAVTISSFSVAVNVCNIPWHVESVAGIFSKVLSYLLYLNTSLNHTLAQYKATLLTHVCHYCPFANKNKKPDSWCKRSLPKWLVSKSFQTYHLDKQNWCDLLRTFWRIDKYNASKKTVHEVFTQNLSAQPHPPFLVW